MSTLPPTDTFDFGENSAHNEAALEELTSAIAFGQGADTITLLLVRCNYTQLRDRMVAALLDKLQVEDLQGQVQVLRLAAQEHNLYAQIQTAMQEERPGAVLVVGTEAVDSLETLLVEMNKRREEFRRDFPFPLVLWFTDDGYRLLSHYANDFESIAGGETIEFRLSGAALSQQLQAAAQRMFEALLQRDVIASFNRRLENLDLGCLRPEEVAIALADLQAQHHPLDPDLQASVAFARGLNVRNEDAIALFEQSAAHWATSSTDSQAVLKRGLSLFYWGRARYFVADNAKYQTPDWEKAVPPLEQSLKVFEAAQRPDLVAQCITQLERVLHRLQRWETLEATARRALALHQANGDTKKLAQDYGFLADVALQRQDWQTAATLAQQALDVPNEPSWWRILYLKMLAEASYGLGDVETATSHLQTAQDMGVMDHPRLHSDVLMGLQQCWRDQRHYLNAFQVKRERLAIEKQYGLRAFIGAGRLRSQRIEQRTTVRSQRETLEDIAPEIAASGRSRDLTELLRRIAGRDDKLLVLHGASGVGKSSLVNGGLLPALQARALENRTNVPVLIRQYTDWPRELATRLQAALADIPHAPVGARLNDQAEEEAAPSDRAAAGHAQTPNPMASSLLDTLRACELATLRPVLIFDQFEEFFFANPGPVARREFFQFIADCLELPGALKIVLSLREDYLHFLLEGKQLVRRHGLSEGSMARSQLEDILGKRILYEIGNFAPNDAKAIIQQLSSGSRMYLEPDLIEALVDDLAGELQEVRPIEMQIVGAQLQTEGIQTLSAYRNLGDQPKETLVQRYLEDVVIDCGEENRQLAELVLFLLTDERGTRPLKTRPELVRDLEAFGIPALQVQEASADDPILAIGQPLPAAPEISNPQPPVHNLSPLDLILRVLCGSGIGVQLPDTPDDRYQLVHDYLAGVIRERQVPRLEALMVELEAEKRRRFTLEEERKTLITAREQAKQDLVLIQQEQKDIQQRTQKAKRVLTRTIVASFLVSPLIAAITYFPLASTARRNTEDMVSQLNRRLMASTANEVSNLFANALIIQDFIESNLDSGAVEIDDPEILGRFQLDTLRANDYVTWISLGFANGDYIGAQRRSDGLYSIIRRQWDDTLGILGESGSALAQKQMQRAQLATTFWQDGSWDSATDIAQKTVETFQFSQGQDWKKIDENQAPELYYAPIRPFYRIAAANPGEQVWTDVYVFSTESALGLDTSKTYQFPGDENIRGVIAISFELRQISQYLASLKGDDQSSNQGAIFIVNSEGNLIAASNSEAFTESLTNNQSADLMSITDVNDPMLQIAHESFLFNDVDLGNLSGLHEIKHYDDHTRQRYYVALTPLGQLDWFVVTVTPESIFLARFNRSGLRALISITFFLGIWALAVAVILRLYNKNDQAILVGKSSQNK